MGCLTPWGAGIETTLEAQAQGRMLPVQGPPAELRADHALPEAGWLDPIPRPAQWLGRPVRFPRLDRLTRLALVSAHMAVEPLAPAILEQGPGGVALGTAFGSHLANEQFNAGLVREGAQGASPALFAYTLPSSAAGEISIHLGLKGAIITLSQGASAGLSALAAAADQVDRGEVQWMVAGGADSLSPTLVRARAEQAHLLAEGAAFLVVGKDPSPSSARVAGWSRATGQGAAQRATAQALQQAGLHRDQVNTRVNYPDDAPGGVDLLSAGPVLAVCSLLTRHAPLPALVMAHDPPHEVVDALCLS